MTQTVLDQPTVATPPVEQMAQMQIQSNNSFVSCLCTKKRRRRKLNLFIWQKSTKSKRIYAPMPDIVSNQNTTMPPSTPQPLQQPMAQQPTIQQPMTQQPMPQQHIAQHTPLGLPPRPAVKPRIDPNQIPSPVQAQLKDEALYANPEYYYGTCNTEQPLPLASTSFRALDQGSSDPRFIRTTLQVVPQDHEMIRDTGLSLGLVIQPLASQPAETPVVPASSLIRCTRCKGYINPWCRFTSGGQRFVCNLCDFENVVDESQFCPSDLNGRRMDTDQHPELMFGSVEFEVPEEYHGGIAPSALHWLLAIDVSRMAIESGMLSAACHSVKKLLAIGLPAYTKIAIMTFDTSLHFYNIKVNRAKNFLFVAKITIKSNKLMILFRLVKVKLL